MSANQPASDYIQRTNAAIDYIVQNLDGDLRLEPIASIAGFSPFHFHRVFKSLMGETLNQFVKRQRLERALYLMSHAPGRSLTEIALDCGFSSSSDFSRSFKSRYGSSPKSFCLDEFRNSKRQEFEDTMASYEQGPQLTRLPPGENPDGFQATIRELPPRTVAYIRVLNPYQSPGVVEASQRLLAWAERRQLADGQWLGYMWEEPELVAIEDCRYDVGLVIDEDQFPFQPQDEIGRYEFPAMLVAEVEVAGDIMLEQRAFDWLYATWLPQSGYLPDDQPAFEVWRGRPFEHGMEYFELGCQLPVKRR